MSKDKLGTYSQWTGENVYDRSKTVTIVNAYTQFFPAVFPPPFYYKAFKKVLEKIKEAFSDKIIGMPKIGCGLAGGDWNRVSKMIEKCFKSKENRIYVYKG